MSARNASARNFKETPKRRGGNGRRKGVQRPEWRVKAHDRKPPIAARFAAHFPSETKAYEALRAWMDEHPPHDQHARAELYSTADSLGRNYELLGVWVRGRDGEWTVKKAAKRNAKKRNSPRHEQPSITVITNYDGDDPWWKAVTSGRASEIASYDVADDPSNPGFPHPAHVAMIEARHPGLSYVYMGKRPSAEDDWARYIKAHGEKAAMRAMENDRLPPGARTQRNSPDWLEPKMVRSKEGIMVLEDDEALAYARARADHHGQAQAILFDHDEHVYLVVPSSRAAFMDRSRYERWRNVSPGAKKTAGRPRDTKWAARLKRNFMNTKKPLL